jgi:hypothetical protein
MTKFQSRARPVVEPLVHQPQLGRVVAHEHGGERGAEAAAAGGQAVERQSRLGIHGHRTSNPRRHPASVASAGGRLRNRPDHSPQASADIAPDQYSRGARGRSAPGFARIPGWKQLPSCHVSFAAPLAPHSGHSARRSMPGWWGGRRIRSSAPRDRRGDGRRRPVQAPPASSASSTCLAMLAPQSHAIQTIGPFDTGVQVAALAVVGEEGVQFGQQGHQPPALAQRRFTTRSPGPPAPAATAGS